MTRNHTQSLWENQMVIKLLGLCLAVDEEIFLRVGSCRSALKTARVCRGI